MLASQIPALLGSCGDSQGGRILERHVVLGDRRKRIGYFLRRQGPLVGTSAVGRDRTVSGCLPRSRNGGRGARIRLVFGKRFADRNDRDHARRGASGSGALNSRQLVLEGVMLPGGPLLNFNPAISFHPRWQDSFSRSYFVVAKEGQSKKFGCILWRLRATRITNPRVVYSIPGPIRCANFLLIACSAEARPWVSQPRKPFVKVLAKARGK